MTILCSVSSDDYPRDLERDRQKVLLVSSFSKPNFCRSCSFTQKVHETSSFHRFYYKCILHSLTFTSSMYMSKCTLSRSSVSEFIVDFDMCISAIYYAEALNKSI